MKLWSLALLGTILCITAADAQTPPSRLLRVSPFASVSQTIGITEVSVSYHRPGVKGREIWNKLVPNGQVWRAGANNATMITFSDDVQVNGNALKAGRYEFFLVPGEKEWKVIFNTAADQWGAYSYDSTKNAAVFTVTPAAAPMEEWLSYSFTDLAMNSATLLVRWEKLAVPVTITTNTADNMKKVEDGFRSQSAEQAALLARWSFDNSTDYERGLAAIDRAITMNPTFGNYALKAQLIAKTEKFADAVKAGEFAVEFGKKNGANTAGVEKMVADWKTKAGDAKGKKK